MIQFLEEKRKRDYGDRMPDVCGGRLSGYAESFRELAKSFEREKPSKVIDRRSYWEEEKLRENCGAIAGHLKELADIMEQTAGEFSLLEPLDEKSRKKLFQILKGEEIILEGACVIPSSVYGKQLSLRLRTQREGGILSEKLEELMKGFAGDKYCLSMYAPGSVERESKTFLFVERPKYMVFTGFARVVKGREEVSGDNYSFLQSERGKLTLMLSDGTGSGEQACMESSWVLDLTEKLLENGYGTEAALHLVNAAAVARGEGIGHPTLDMCQLDLRRGSCEFCKAGGAVSYRKRGHDVEEISGGRLPLGIFQNLEAHRSVLNLKEGDSVIMLTDGVLEAFREKGYEEAVRDAIAVLEAENPRELSEKLMQLAIFGSQGNIRDDMTILAATLWKNP